MVDKDADPLITCRKEIDKESLVQEHIGWMLNLAESMLRERGAAEDVVQDAFIAAFRGLSDFQSHSSLKTWLHRITVNTAIDRLRKVNRLAEQPIDDLLPRFDSYDCRIEPIWGHIITPQEIAESQDLQQLVQQKINALPAVYRIVLQLRDVQQYNTTEVAEILGLTPANVKVRLHRARAALKKLLEPVLRGEISHDT